MVSLVFDPAGLFLYTRYKIRISAEKIKLITSSVNGIQKEIKVKGQKMGTVTIFTLEQLSKIIVQS